MKSLKEGETLKCSISYSSGRMEAAFSSKLSMPKVCEEKAIANLKRDLGTECTNCPYVSITSRHFKDYAIEPDRATVMATAECKLRGRCPEPIEEFPIYESMSRGGGMSISFDKHKHDSPRIKGHTYSDIYVDEVDIEQDLEEVAEFETQPKKYDNFGSW
ncbi:hypothetical protein VCR15J2_390076 [Vibrio coralliirubri]|uniref:hypothetical protein n=1 Tax=Vibrio coralliirubri TaxID=1516159 RepID=UPI00063712C6|nr:hypothetical protein [Vibrio coralliirubri]CDT53467.1 hypothetical protein VCR15J2_390076 [Vibrio coralliirubri]